MFQNSIIYSQIGRDVSDFKKDLNFEKMFSVYWKICSSYNNFFTIYSKHCSLYTKTYVHHIITKVHYILEKSSVCFKNILNVYWIQKCLVCIKKNHRLLKNCSLCNTKLLIVYYKEKEKIRTFFENANELWKRGHFL